MIATATTISNAIQAITATATRVLSLHQCLFYNIHFQAKGLPTFSGGYRFSFPPSPKIFGLPAKRFPPPPGPP